MAEQLIVISDLVPHACKSQNVADINLDKWAKCVDPNFQVEPARYCLNPISKDLLENTTALNIT